MESPANGTTPELPRHVLVSTRLGPPVEMARWLFETWHIPYEEQAHAPIFHAFVSRRHRVGIELPLVLTPDGPWVGLKGFLLGLDAKTRPGQRLLGETEAERAQTLEWVDLFYDKLFWPAVQTYYHFMLDNRETVTKYALDRAPDWQKFLVSKGFRFWHKAMVAGIKLENFDLEATLASIDAAFDAVGAACEGQRFLGGDRPGTADIVFASLSGPLLLPGRFAAPLPSLDELPAAYREIVERYRAHPAGRIAGETYELARPEPQPPMKRPGRDWSLTGWLTGSTLPALALRSLVRFRPTLRLRGAVLALSWQNATEVLRRDSDFAIEPVNKEKITAVSGPFILGMDRTAPDIFAQREAVYTAMRAARISPARTILDTEAQRLLADAAERYGRIDVVNGYARLVAARTATAIFGITGPTEADMTRVLRAVFHETFLNPKNDRVVRDTGIAAGRELGDWIDAEIARRGDTPGDDVLGGLIRAQKDLPLDPEAVRWMLAGLIVGAVDTTATSVAKAAKVLLSRRQRLQEVRRDLDDPDRMLGWCYEALRQLPHNPIVLRKTRHATSLGQMQIAPGTSVIPVTLAAMQDARQFPRPGRLLPGRERNRYLHFGYGLHCCSGRDVNDWQIPALVAHLLRAGASGVERFRTRGPFPDEMIVRLGADQ
ncbi:cytochrome P450 [Tropicimonas sp. IMCC34043]|uniref:cytochrome P450 n=1 Tax=Tropicimonas sp. IMCC34043 TaxID=2248760 RepID=UPI0013007F86|nr:cytochrome P450 [Tropicimonas sp. IMCC34043]